MTVYGFQVAVSAILLITASAAPLYNPKDSIVFGIGPTCSHDNSGSLGCTRAVGTVLGNGPACARNVDNSVMCTSGGDVDELLAILSRGPSCARDVHGSLFCTRNVEKRDYVMFDSVLGGPLATREEQTSKTSDSTLVMLGVEFICVE